MRLEPGEIALGSRETIKMLVKASSEEMVHATIVCLIEEMQSGFNINQKMSPSQIFKCVDELMIDFAGYRLEEFQKCFLMARKAEFGKLEYNRIDQAVLYDWLDQYDLIRTEQIIKQRAQDASKLKDWTIDDVKDEKGLVGLDKLKSLAERFQHQKRAAQDPSPKQYDNFHQDCMKEFDQLFFKGRIDSGGKRFVIYNGSKCDIEEFLQIKIEEELKRREDEQ